MNFSKSIILAVFIITLVGCNKTAKEHVNEAHLLIQKGDKSAAIIELKNAIKQSPNDGDIRFKLAELYFELGAMDFAEKEYSLALKHNFDASRIVNKVIESHYFQGEYSEVLNYELNPALPQKVKNKVKLKKALSLVALDKTSEAKLLFEELESEHPKSVEGIISKAYLLALVNRNEAIELIDTAQLSELGNTDALLLKAKIHSSLGNFQAAIENYQKHLTLMPNVHSVRFFLADTYLKNSQFKEAKEQADIILRLSDNHPFANQVKAITSFEEAQYESALIHIEKAIHNGLANTNNKLLAGLSAFQLKKNELAIKYLEPTITSLNSSHPAVKALAVSYFRTGEVENAATLVDGIENVTNQDIKLYIAAAFHLIKAGRVDLATQSINKVEQFTAKTPFEETQLGILKLNSGDITGISSLESALEKNSELESAKISLVQAYLQTDNTTKALKIADSLIEQSPENVMGYNLAAAVHLYTNNVEKADAFFAKALIINEDNTPSLFHMTQKAIAKKDWNVAQKYLDRILINEPNNIQALRVLFSLAKLSKNTEMSYVLEKLRSAHELTPNNQISYLYALALTETKEYHTAKTVISKSLTQDDSFLPSWLLAIQIEDETRQYAAALNIVKDGLNIFPNQDELRVLEANYLISMNDVQGAQSSVSKISTKNQQIPFVINIIGQILAHQGNYKEALPKLKIGYKNMPNTRNASLVFVTLVTANNPNEAAIFLEEHLINNPSDFGPRLLLANFYFASNKSKAEEHYLKVLDVNPTNITALNNLSFILYENKQYNKAESYINKAIKITESNSQVLDTAGLIQIKLGNKSKAIEILEKAVLLAPNDENIKENLASAKAL